MLGSDDDDDDGKSSERGNKREASMVSCDMSMIEISWVGLKHGLTKESS